MADRGLVVGVDVRLDPDNAGPAIALADFKKEAHPDCGGHASPLKVPEPTENAHATPIVARYENVALRVVDVHDPARDFSLRIVLSILFGIRLVPSAQALRPLHAQLAAVDFSVKFDRDAVAWLYAGMLQDGRVNEHGFAGRIVVFDKTERPRVVPSRQSAPTHSEKSSMIARSALPLIAVTRVVAPWAGLPNSSCVALVNTVTAVGSS